MDTVLPLGDLLLVIGVLLAAALLAMLVLRTEDVAAI